MRPPCRFLEWDTAFFGCRIATITIPRLDAAQLDSIMQWANDHAMDCLYFLADADHPDTTHLVENCGFHLQDVRMTFALKRPSQPTVINDDPYLRLSQPDDYTLLSDTARTAYVQSRFYHDPHFTDDKCAAFYDLWLQRSILEDYADAVWVADGTITSGGITKIEPLGYVTCHINQQQHIGEIKLVGVREAARGQHVASRLLQAALAWFWQHDDHHVQAVQVVTQGRNIAAQRLYQRNGFLTHQVQLWYHKWLTDCIVG